jgi:hypothetical protein
MDIAGDMCILFARVGLATEVAAYLYAQGGGYFGGGGFFYDKDIDSLVKQLKHPGGTIINGGQDMANPGYLFSIRAEVNLKSWRFYMCHLQHCSRTPTPKEVTLQLVRGMRDQKEYERNFKVTADHLVIDTKYWPKTIDSI